LALAGANKNRLIAVAVGVLVLWGIYYFITSQHEQREIDAGQALTLLLINPAANTTSGQISDAFAKRPKNIPAPPPASAPSCRPRRRCSTPENTPTRRRSFQKYLDAGSGGALAATAALGVAASLEAQNKLEPAVAAYQRSRPFMPVRPACCRRNLRWAASPSSKTN